MWKYTWLKIFVAEETQRNKNLIQHKGKLARRRPKPSAPQWSSFLFLYFPTRWNPRPPVNSCETNSIESVTGPINETSGGVRTKQERTFQQSTKQPEGRAWNYPISRQRLDGIIRGTQKSKTKEVQRRMMIYPRAIFLSRKWWSPAKCYLWRYRWCTQQQTHTTLRAQHLLSNSLKEWR